MVTWEPWGDEQTQDGDLKSPFSRILDTTLDEYIAQFARDMKAYGYSIRLRFGHEMIQNDIPKPRDPSTWGWYPWQDYPEDYVAAY